ncbi:MAG: hypothetical protein IKR11_01315 [Solobacterium sp.]|nr:hypothetical protein [Solobacterium sp.]
MAKKKTKRKSLKLLNFTLVLFLFSSTLYLASSLFLRSYNNSLSTQSQEILAEIKQIEIQNDAIEVEIANLESTERIEAIAANNGLTRNQDNVVMVSADIEDGE